MAQFLKRALQIWRACGGLAVVAGSTGCGCVTTEVARAMDEQLVRQNRANAEPAMEAAAQRFGGVLLPTEAEEFEMSPFCGLSGDPCLDEVEVDESSESVSRVRDARGRARLAIWVPVELRGYARLAQRPNGLLVLSPKVSRRVTDEKTCCECDRMLRAEPRTRAAFLVDEAASLQIVHVTVPMTLDVYKWKCKAIAV